MMTLIVAQSACCRAERCPDMTPICLRESDLDPCLRIAAAYPCVGERRVSPREGPSHRSPGVAQSPAWL